jgi:hypothetical protein
MGMLRALHAVCAIDTHHEPACPALRCTSMKCSPNKASFNVQHTLLHVLKPHSCQLDRVLLIVYRQSLERS